MLKLTFLSLLIVSFLGACGGDDPAPTPAPTPTHTPTTAPSTTTPTPPPVVADVPAGRPRLLDFDEEPQSVYLIDLGKVDSWAALIDLGGRSEIRLFLPASTEPAQAHIHSGECGGAVEHELSDVTDRTSSTDLDVPTDDLLKGGFSIDVHASQQEIACGSIPGTDNLVTFEMNEANESGLSGWATLYGGSEESQIVMVIYLNPGTRKVKTVQIREMKCTQEFLDPANFGAALEKAPKRQNLEVLIHGFSSTTFYAPFDDLVKGDLAVVPGPPTGHVTALGCGDIPSK